MADFPSFEENVNRPTTPVTITPPAFDGDQTRDLAVRRVEQQWRDAKALGLGTNHPLSINRDADEVS